MNKNDKIINKGSLFFALISLLFFLAMLLIEIKNDRFEMNDFRVMYEAANGFINGSVVYGESFGLATGFYKYSPFTALLFSPFTLFSFKTASIIYYWIVALAGTLSILVIENHTRNLFFKNSKKKSFILYVILIFVIIHIVREAHLGNTNLVLILLTAVSLISYIKNKKLLSAILMCMVILTKPYLIVFGIPFLLLKDWKYIIISILTFISLNLIPIFITGVTDGIELYKDWIEAMLSHSGYLSSPNTISSLFELLFGMSLPSIFGYIGFIIASALISIWSYVKIKDPNKFISFSIFMMLALAPSFLVTDTEHFLFSLPIITILVISIFELRSVWITFGIVISFILYSFNSTDLLGKDLSQIVFDYGLLGISNIIILTLSLIVVRRTEGRKELSSEK
jgi:hypothetical protein